MAMDEHYRKVRAAVRELGCRDSLYVIWAYCQYLQVDDFRMPDDIQVHRQFLDAPLPQAVIAEFNLEQIAREVIRHADIEPRRGRTLRRWDTLAAIVKDLRALDRLRAEHALDEGFAYRYSSLREFPLVRISHLGREEVACPIPTLLFWRITTGLYYTLKDVPGFLTEFGSSFQRYVGEVLQQRITSPEREVLAEQEYHVGYDRKDTVDWIVQQGDEAALFIECKTKRLTWASKAALADLTALQADLNTLAAAVVQVYKTIADYRESHYPQLPFVEARQVLPIVVTLEDWHFVGREIPARLDASIRLKMAEVGLPEVWLAEMPYSILSMHELESSARFFNEIDISTLVLGRALDPKYSRWGFAAYCSDRYGRDRPALPPLFQDEYDALFAHLA